MKNMLKWRYRKDHIEYIMEGNYILTDNDIWIIRELIRKRRLSLFTSVTFAINKKVHIDFYDFDLGRIHIFGNK